jgi:TRAP-type C4-dicarboxylate transport system substrate-binding protein
MLKLNYAPLMGAALIRKATWERIPKGARKILRDSAKTAGKQINTKARAESNESVKAMEKRGLKVQKVTPDIERVWIERAEVIYPRIRGTEVPEDVFDEVIRLLGEFRTGN